MTIDITPTKVGYVISKNGIPFKICETLNQAQNIKIALTIH